MDRQLSSGVKAALYFRYVLIALCAGILLLFVAGIILGGLGSSDAGFAWMFFSLTALLIGGPSLVAVIGLRRNQRWGAWVAVAHSTAIYLILGYQAYVSFLAPDSYYEMVWVWLICGTPFLVEALGLITLLARGELE